jgi:hypothetical protein
VRRLGLVALAALGACGGGLDAGGDPVEMVEEDDPLLGLDPPAPGSLDELHRDILVKSCAGTPGLCHAGQFEPNLSTPAIAYLSLVNRPSNERERGLRVKAGAPEESLLVDKLRGRDVATQMPLGAEPLSEEDLQRVEAWIAAGALRAPGAEPAPILDNPPERPEVGVFEGTARLDAGGPARVRVGDTVTLRMSARDFETDDGDIPFAAFVLAAPGNRNMVLDPSADDPGVGPATYQAGGPMGAGDTLDFRRDVTIPATVELVDEAGAIEPVPAAGLLFSLIALYVDGLPVTAAFVTFTIAPNLIQVEE